MRPIKIVISAFGPYAETMPAIDFEQFEEQGLFLVAGDTGAGKTTIFDAICFALYGTTSGTYRDTKNLRSEYAKDSVESHVDFYFTHQGKQYHVWRRPAYERKKLRGTGTVSEKEKAVLYEEEKVPVEGLSNVNNAVIELLGINEKQFKQIAMIAQGEFWALLNAKTDERTEILRTIFMTNAYKAIEFRLKDRMDESCRKKTAAENSIVQYFGDVTADEKDELAAELRDLQGRAARAGSAFEVEEMLQLIGEILRADRERFETLGEEIGLEHLTGLKAGAVRQAELAKHLLGGGAALGEVDVLRANLDVGALRGRLRGGDVHGRDADHHVAGGVLHQGLEGLHQGLGLGGGLVHFPVTGNDCLAHGKPLLSCLHEAPSRFARGSGLDYFSSRQATPGSTLPSRYSRDAPPPVEM